MELGGMGVDSVTTAVIVMELHRTFVPFRFGGAADNILYACDEKQKDGYSREMPIERWYGELCVLRIFEGTDEIQRGTLARNLLNGNVQTGQFG